MRECAHNSQTWRTSLDVLKGTRCWNQGTSPQKQQPAEDRSRRARMQTSRGDLHSGHSQVKCCNGKAGFSTQWHELRTPPTIQGHKQCIEENRTRRLNKHVNNNVNDPSQGKDQPARTPQREWSGNNEKKKTTTMHWNRPQNAKQEKANIKDDSHCPQHVRLLPLWVHLLQLSLVFLQKCQLLPSPTKTSTSHRFSNISTRRVEHLL